MWFFGVIIGLAAGAALESFPVACVLAIAGGLVGKQLGQSNPQQKTTASTSTDSITINALHQKITSLEKRLRAVERQLAQQDVAADSGSQLPSSEPKQKPAMNLNQNTEVFDLTLPPDYVELPAPANLAANSLKAVVSAPSEQVQGALPKVSSTTTLPNVAPIETTEIHKTPTPPPAPKATLKAILKTPKPVIPFKDRLPEPARNLIYGGNTLVKIGVLILFLGLAFLLRYTAERVTVPIELRYACVALAGAGLLALGWFLRRRRADYALIMQGMGIGVFYLTTLAAMKFHALIPTEAGFGFMFLVSILGAALAILQKAPTLAIIAALEGFATPILTASGGNHMMGLFTYLSILDAGIVLVAWFNAWRILNLIGFVGTFTLAIGWANQYYSDEQYAPVQAFLILFFLLFTAIGVFFARRTLIDAKELVSESTKSLSQQASTTLAQVGRVDSALVFGTPITAFGLQYLLSKPWEFGPAFSAMAIAAFYFLLARVIFSRECKGLALMAEAYAIVGLIFATLAIPLGLEGVWTGAAWAVEGAGMYWLGIRQHRPYARGFAYLVLAGASYKLLQSVSINSSPDGALLQGTAIGPLLLAISAFAVWAQHRLAKFDVELNWETVPGKCLPWLGMAALTILPWQWLTPTFAAAATAGLSVMTYFVARRLDLKALFPIVGCLQALAVASFTTTLHTAPNIQGNGNNAVLDSGLQGMLAAITIAASILLTAGWSMVRARKTAMASGLPPAWPKTNSLAIVVGVGLLHLAMLFSVSLQQAIIIWPITSCVILWVALRMSHSALAGTAVSLQLISAALFMLRQDLFNGLDVSSVADDVTNQIPAITLAPFGHPGFWAPLIFGLIGWLSGDWIRREAKLFLTSGGASDTSINTHRWFNPWCANTGSLWLPVFWGLSWWLTAWITESSRVLELQAIPEYLMAAIVAIILFTSIAIATVARWRNWQQMGVTSTFTLPAWIVCAYFGIAGSSLEFVPSAYLGWIFWPFALIWHLRLVYLQERWILQAQRSALHIVGFWFFLLLAARECQVRFGQVGDAVSSWAMLGWVLVPALSFWLLRSALLEKRWPLTEFRKDYLETACTPVAAYLLAWCFISNIVSAGNASPLPYLPLFNPLELGQWLVVAALLLWWHTLPDESAVKLESTQVRAIGALTGLALITGMVLRSCHHFAAVAWSLSALFDSRLTQAAVSITWATLGVLVMLFGNRRASRVIWAGGAALLAVVVLKLFVVELADRGGLYRIVSFIGVGVLLLVVGYFAPVPVKTASAEDSDEDRLETK